MSTNQVNIEQLAINTIRTLSMDAVQAANSGHPGTPMALAPAAYVLFNEVMRYNPAAARLGRTATASCFPAAMPRCCCIRCCIWPKSSRSARTASRSDEPAVPLDDIRRFRQLDSRCPGHPEYRHTGGVETTTGPLGQGIANSVGMAMAARWLGRALQPARLRAVRLQHLRPLQRRRSDGRRRRRGRLDRRASQARQSLLDLRRQHDHDRRQHRSGVQRRRRPAFRRLRLERAESGRRERSAEPPRGRRKIPENDRPAHADHRPQRDRLRLAEQGQHPRRARRAAGRRGNQAHQGGLRLAGKRIVPRAGRSAQAFRGRDCRPGRKRRIKRGTRCSPSTRKSFPNWPPRSNSSSAANCPPIGTPTCSRSPPMRRAWPAAFRRARCSIKSPSACRGSSAARPIWPPRPTRC